MHAAAVPKSSLIQFVAIKWLRLLQGVTNMVIEVLETRRPYNGSLAIAWYTRNVW